MKNLSRLYDSVALGCLLLAIGSALAILTQAQGSRDQDQPTVTLNLNASYTAEAKLQNKETACEDHLTVTYKGSAHYTLLPVGTGTTNVDPNNLTDYPRAGFHSDRTGSFTVDVQGGGNCVNTKDGGKRIWTYNARYKAVPPNEFPSIGLQLRPGDYRVGYEFPESVITAQGQLLPGGRDLGLRPGGAPLDTKQRPNPVAPAQASIPFQASGPAMFPLLAVMQQSIPKVSAALHGTFTPYSREFSGSNSVSDTFQMPPNNAGQTGTASLNIFYTLTVGNPEEVEAVIIPQKGTQKGTWRGIIQTPYEKWMPEAGDNEDADGNKLDVKVVLQKKGQPGNKPAQGAQFKLELVEVSKEPGVCLNWPPKAQVKDPPDFDLKIDKNNPYFESSTDDGQSALSKPKLKEIQKLSIISHDYGAWGKLKVTAKLEDGTSIVAHVKDKPDIEALSIPKDDNGNHIADVWEKQVKDKSPTSDNDIAEWQELPQGDGLSLYEEYRGFLLHHHRGHVRTDPEVPDVFIYDQDDMGPGYFGRSGLDAWIVDRNELAFEKDPNIHNPYIVNFNYHNAHLGNQHAIWLRNLDPGEGLAGIDLGGPGPPKTSFMVKVGRDKLEQLNYSRFDIDSVIAHELAHAVNVWHHGDNNYKVKQVWKLIPGGVWAKAWLWLDTCKPPKTCTYTVAAQGGQESGVEDCIMRYSSARLYEWDQGPYRWLKNGKFQRGDKYGPAQPSGDLFCRDLVGTGVNAPRHQPVPLAGNASRGGCAAQFCANDTKTCIGAPH